MTNRTHVGPFTAVTARRYFVTGTLYVADKTPVATGENVFGKMVVVIDRTDVVVDVEGVEAPWCFANRLTP